MVKILHGVCDRHSSKADMQPPSKAGNCCIKALLLLLFGIMKHCSNSRSSLDEYTYPRQPRKVPRSQFQR